MKAKVYVTLKSSVLDPQGKAIHHTTELLGFENVGDIRQGKYFEIDIDDSLSEEKRLELLNTLSKDILSNPVIETYKIID